MSRHAKLGLTAPFLLAGLLVALAGLDTFGVLLASAGAVCLVPVIRGLVRRQHDVFEPSFLYALGFGVLFVIRPMFEWSSVTGAPMLVGVDPTSTYLAAMFVATVGGMSFHAGYYSRFGVGLADRMPRAPEALDGVRIRFGVLGLTVAGVALYAAFLIASGGLGSITAVIAGRNADFASMVSQPVGYLYSGLLLLFPAGMILLATTGSWRSLSGVAGFALVVIAVLPAVFSGSRVEMLPALAAVGVLAYLRRGTRPRLLTMISLALVGFVLLISVPRDYRGTDDRTGTLLDAVATSVAHAETTGRDFILGLDTAMLPALAIELSYVPDVIPFQLGSSYIEAALRPIPRAVWSEKPDAASTQLMRVLWPDLYAVRVGLAFSFFGEPYLNFGLPGVVVISSLFGVAWRSLWEYWHRQPKNVVAIGILAISWPFLIVYMRGGIAVDYQRQLIALVPFVALAWLAARDHDFGARQTARVRNHVGGLKTDVADLSAETQVIAQDDRLDAQ